MVIEHTSHAYDAAKLWLYMDAKSQFVASAAWKEERRSNTSFNGPAVHLETTQLLSAESDDLGELRAWCVAQIAAGAKSASIHETWPITQPARLAGKRDNKFLERVA